MQMPRPLDRLYRFNQHDSGEEDCAWTVSGGSLENNKRYYRVMYDESEKKEWELIININESPKVWSREIEEYKNQIVDWMKKRPMSAYFVHALFELFSMDPWFSYKSSEMLRIENKL
jgi:hypothetical protein